MRDSLLHELEEIPEKLAIHGTEFPMPQSIAYFESEQVFLNRAYSTGPINLFDLYLWQKPQTTLAIYQYLSQ